MTGRPFFEPFIQEYIKYRLLNEIIQKNTSNQSSTLQIE